MFNICVGKRSLKGLLALPLQVINTRVGDMASACLFLNLDLRLIRSESDPRGD